MITIMDAVQALKPGSECIVRGNTYSGIEWLDESQTQPTEDEVNAKVTELASAEPIRLLREERDQRLIACDWVVTKNKELGTNIPAAWKTYRQALRDLPASSTPTLDSNGYLNMSSVTWPTKPT